MNGDLGDAVASMSQSRNRTGEVKIMRCPEECGK